MNKMFIDEGKILRLLPESKLNVFVSGGFDSCVLAYFIAQHRQFNICTVPRYDDSLGHSKRVIEWLQKKTGKSFRLLVVGDPDVHHSQQVRSGLMEMIRDRPNEILVLADTTNPPVELSGEPPLRIRSNDERVIQPFFDYHKNSVILFAESLGILDEVASITHTCTDSVSLRCCKCWQCNERKWAFTVTDKVDIGTM